MNGVQQTYYRIDTTETIDVPHVDIDKVEESRKKRLAEQVTKTKQQISGGLAGFMNFKENYTLSGGLLGAIILGAIALIIKKNFIGFAMLGAVGGGFIGALAKKMKNNKET